MRYTINNLIIDIDETTGSVCKIVSKKDKYDFNWVLETYSWGDVYGDFFRDSVRIAEQGAVITYKKDGLEMLVERCVENGKYVERYRLKNVQESDYFITQDSFGIRLPFNCLQKRKVEPSYNYEKTCCAHVWCGGNVCWVYGEKLSGNGDKLLIQMVQGDISDYSILRDGALTKFGADYRGEILLNPAPVTLKSGQVKVYEFVYSFVQDVKAQLQTQKEFIYATADIFTPSIHQTSRVFVEYNGDKKLEISCGKKKIQYRQENGVYFFDWKAARLGEQIFHIKAGANKTFIKLLCVRNIQDILLRRARFIVKNQQYKQKNSPLYGAYLIYDNEEKLQYYSPVWDDANAGRERIGMGLAVLYAYKATKSEVFLRSLKKHLAFVLRELVNEETGEVFNRVGKKSDTRIYNYPWFSEYFLLWYLCVGEVRYLQLAAKIFLRYYALGGAVQESQLLNGVGLFEALRKAGLEELAGQVKQSMIAHADSILSRGYETQSIEICIVNEIPNVQVDYLAQAYALTGEEKYLDGVERSLKTAQALYSFQPDYHLFAISVRHWDGFWFGKRRTYGDVMPHYWSMLLGHMYYSLRKNADRDYAMLIRNIMRNNLCLFFPDGSAANNYLYPYKVDVYYSKEITDKNHLIMMPKGAFYGKRYDAWANDQDFALAYAYKILSDIEQ